MFRLDRFLTLYLFHPLIMRCRTTALPVVPILMYHGISEAKRYGAHPYYETTTSPSVLSLHMGFLKDNGYRTIGLKGLARVFHEHVADKQKFVVITFDDGLYDFCTHGFLILKQNGFSATVFLSAGLMGQRLAGQTVMMWDHARDLAAKGVSFGSHSMNHPKLIELDQNAVEYEIKHSREIIGRELGKEIDSFSYPYAFPEQDQHFVGRIETLLLDNGYRWGVTTTIGRSSGRDNALFLKRLPINDYDDPRFFKAKLEGGYDWVRVLQSYSKKIRYALTG